jgi:hypothetical protein
MVKRQRTFLDMTIPPQSLLGKALVEHAKNDLAGRYCFTVFLGLDNLGVKQVHIRGEPKLSVVQQHTRQLTQNIELETAYYVRNLNTI